MYAGTAIPVSRVGSVHVSDRARPIEGDRVIRPAEGLVAKAAAGDAKAFEDLVRQVGRPLYAFLRVRLENESDALDAVQDALLAAWQGLPRLSRTDRFWPWLVGIGLHKAKDRARRQVRLRASEAAFRDAYRNEEAAAESERDIALRDAINHLPHHLRDVVLLQYMVGLSEAETAAVLRIRLGTVKSRRARAKKRLAHELQADYRGGES